MPKGAKPSRQEKLDHLREAFRYVRNWRLAVDVGAHIGNWSQLMAEKFERVIAFEPMEDNRARWYAKMADYQNAELSGAAVGDRSRMVRMDGVGHSKHFAVADPAGDTEMVTLDEYKLESLDLLKVDAEGADTLVLRGAEGTLRLCRPVVIVESLPKFEARYGLDAGAPMAFLRSIGARQVANLWCDYIFVFPDR